jgi:hypothetical protein
MDKGQCFELTIHRMPEGGYVVIRGGGFDTGRMSQPLFASGVIDEALGFIRDQIVPIPPQAGKSA